MGVDKKTVKNRVLSLIKEHQYNIHNTNDRDAIRGRLKEDLLTKSIVQQPESGVDLNTAEQSLDEIASRPQDDWVDRIDSLMAGYDYADEPRELHLPGDKVLILSKVDERTYSGFVKDTDSSSGSYGEIAVQLTKMTPEAIVQALKAKGLIPLERTPSLPEANPVTPDYASLLAGLQSASREIHIHIHKAEILGNLLESLEKGRVAALGEVRTWHDGNKYQKTAQGWVPVRYGKPQAQPHDSTDAFKHSKLPAEQNKKHQNMTHDPDYLKPGKEIEMSHASKFIKEIQPEFHAMQQDLEKKLSKFGEVSGRLKDAKSATDKMKGRFAERSLNSLTDAMGFRVVTKTPEEAQKAIEHIKKTYPVVEEEDFNEKPKDGYRAMHLLIQTPGGRVAEVQIKTEMQQALSSFTHNNIYKGEEHIKNHPDTKKFVNELSDHLNKRDKGLDPGAKPKEPQILKDAGIKFDWSKLEGKGEK